MKRYFALYFALAILLVGCASNTNNRGWSKAGATDEQIRRDLVACQGAAPGRGAGRFARGMRQTPLQGDIDSCMRGKGYK